MVWLQQIQPRSGYLCIIKGVEKGGSGRLDESAQPRQQRLIRQESGCSCIPKHVWNLRLGLSVACSELSSVNPGKSLSSDLGPTSPKIFGVFFFLKDCVTVHSQNVVDPADAKALAMESCTR